MPHQSIVMPVAIFVLIAAAVWAVVELALTLRATRRDVGAMRREVSEAIDAIEPVVGKVEGIVDELDPAVKQVDPLLTRVNTAVDALTCDLVRAEEVLDDVSKVTGASAQASEAITSGVARATEAVTGGVASVFGRISGRGRRDGRLSGAEPASLGAAGDGRGEQDAPEPPAEDAAGTASSGYFEYPDAAAADAEGGEE